MSLEGKSILFISHAFFGYEQSIYQRLRELGASVDYFDERPANSFWIKAFMRVNPQIIFYSIERYYNRIEHIIKNKQYDYIFIISIEAMPQSFLKRLRKDNLTAKFILYMWDSILNRKNTISYIPFFDDVFSFDTNDCRQVSGIRFRPLFYLNEYQKIANYTDFEYDFTFIGTAHSDRFCLISKIKKQIAAKKMRGYWFLYLQSKKLFFWNKINNIAFRKARIRDFDYRPLSPQSTLDKIKKSAIVLDIQHPKQSGLTMRTFEMLGAKRKLVTTNQNIREYDFYSPDNILIIDRNQPMIPDEFCKSSYRTLSDEIYYKYSIDGWIEEIFS